MPPHGASTSAPGVWSLRSWNRKIPYLQAWILVCFCLDLTIVWYPLVWGTLCRLDAGRSHGSDGLGSIRSLILQRKQGMQEKSAALPSENCDCPWVIDICMLALALRSKISTSSMCFIWSLYQLLVLEITGTPPGNRSLARTLLAAEEGQLSCAGRSHTSCMSPRVVQVTVRSSTL